jgi:hypothetical protein
MLLELFTMHQLLMLSSASLLPFAASHSSNQL